MTSIIPLDVKLLDFQAEPPSSPEAVAAYREFGLPADFFEGEQSEPLFNLLEIMKQVPKNFSPSNILEPGPHPCPKNQGLFLYNPATGKSMTLPCKSRTCEVCGKFWGLGWRNRLNWNEYFNKDDKALTLTSACDPGYKAFWLALGYFWRNLRNYAQVRPQLVNKETGEIRPKLYRKIGLESGKTRWMELKQKKLAPAGEYFRILRPFRKLEYFGVVEYNQNHTQPHFHFVLRAGYIPQVVIKKCWERAQVAAHFPVVAFDVRIEQIKTSVKQYFFKYITKQAGAKDELPRPGQWSGRGVRYSREYFGDRAPVMKAAITLAEQHRRGEYSKFHSLHSKVLPISWQKADADYFHAEEKEIVNQPWEPFADRERGGEPQLRLYTSQFEPFSRDMLPDWPPGGREEGSQGPPTAACERSEGLDAWSIDPGDNFHWVLWQKLPNTPIQTGSESEGWEKSLTVANA